MTRTSAYFIHQITGILNFSNQVHEARDYGFGLEEGKSLMKSKSSPYHGILSKNEVAVRFYYYYYLPDLARATTTQSDKGIDR